MGLLDAARLDLVKSTEEYIAAVHTRWEVGDTTESYRYHLHQTRQALVEAVQVLRLAQELGEVVPETSSQYRKAEGIFSAIAKDCAAWLVLVESSEPQLRLRARLSATDLHESLLGREDELLALSREVTGQEATDIRTMAEQVKEVREGRFAVAWHELLRAEGKA